LLLDTDITKSMGYGKAEIILSMFMMKRNTAELVIK